MFQMNNCAKLFWNSCINVQVIVCGQAHFMTIFSFDFQVCPWPSTYLNQCFKWTTVPFFLLKSMHKCKVMAWTSSIYDHFIIWPSSVTLTFNLPKKNVSMAFLLLKENNCAQLFWNSCINVEVMVQTNAGGHTHAQHMLIHQTEVVTTMSRSLQMENKNNNMKT